MASCCPNRRSASASEVGVSSDATVVCVRDSQAWKSSRSLSPNYHLTGATLSKGRVYPLSIPEQKAKEECDE